MDVGGGVKVWIVPFRGGGLGLQRGLDWGLFACLLGSGSADLVIGKYQRYLNILIKLLQLPKLLINVKNYGAPG